jgi:hypothetical protein
MAAPFVANPTGDAEVQIEIEIGASLIEARREAMRDATRQLRSMLAHDPHEFLVSIALVQKDRLTDLRGELELPLERVDLCRVRGEVAEEVETAFADGNDFGLSGQRVECLQLSGIQLDRVMRMNARRTAHRLRMLLYQGNRAVCARKRAARNEQASHADLGGMPNDGVAVLIEAVVRQIDADVQQRGR